MNEELKKKIDKKLFELECKAFEIRDMVEEYGDAWELLDSIQCAISEVRSKLDELEED
jgi:hypothetical protein